MIQEVLETGRDRSRSGVPDWLLWTLGVAALVLITAANLAVAGELATRSLEADRLVRAVESSESAMKATQEEFNSVLSSYDSSNLTEGDRERLRGELADVAARGEQAIATAGEGVADVRILPWHTSLLDARDAYLAHNRAWIDYMAAAAADPAEWFRPQPAVNDTFAGAKLPLAEAVPLLDPLNTLARIELIYVTGSGGSSGGQTA